MTIELVDPVDRSELSTVDGILVSGSGRRYDIVDGIPQLIRPERLTSATAFAASYGAVRAAEGRTSEGGDYYRALPYDDLTGNFVDQWRRRAGSYDALVQELEIGTGRAPGDPADKLRIVDSGAGNCWLSALLAAMGHDVLAVDVNDDDNDGLRAARHYPQEFGVARAEADALPVTDDSVDVVILNAAAHYLDFKRVTAESARIVGSGGRVIIVDSPLYRRADAGQSMIDSMSSYIRSLGVDPATYPGRGFLTVEDLDGSALRWRSAGVDGGGLRAMKRKAAGLRAGRELATMPLLVAQVPAQGLDVSNPAGAEKGRV